MTRAEFYMHLRGRSAKLSQWAFLHVSKGTLVLFKVMSALEWSHV